MAFKLDLSKFKKVSSAKDHTVMRDQRGNEIKVAHAQLSPKLRGQLAELPVHKAEGGEIADPTAESAERAPASEQAPVVVNVNQAPQAPADAMMAAYQKANPPVQGPPAPVAVPKDPMGAAYATAANKAAAAPVTPAPAQAPAVQQGPAPASVAAPAQAPQQPAAAPAAANPLLGATPDAQVAGLRKQEAGIQSEALAQAAQAQAQANVLRSSQEIQRQAVVQQQAFVADQVKEIQALNADVKAGHVDPNRYMGSKTTGQKVMTAIGIILGGIGGGLLKTENPALKFLNQQIERDVEAQRADMDKRKTLLSANMQQFQDIGVAMKMTQAMQMDLVKTQLQVEEQKAQDPIVKARAQQAIGKIDVEIAAKVQEAAKMRVLNGMLASTAQDPAQLPAMLNAMRTMDPKRAEEMERKLVPGMGFALTPEDAKAMKDMNADAIAARKSIERLKEINKVPFKSLSPGARTEAYSLSKSLVGQLNRAFTGGGPMSQGEQELLNSVAKNPTGFFQLDSSNAKALATLEKTLDTKVRAAAESKGINVPSPETKLSAQQKSFVKWARENPKDPRSAIILQKLGLD